MLVDPENQKEKYLTKHIRKNLFGVRPKTRSYSGVYHSRNYQNMTIDDVFIVRQKSFKKPHRGDQKSLQKQWKTIQMKDKIIGVDRFQENSIQKFRNNRVFIRNMADQQAKDSKIRETVREGTISLTTQKQQKYFENLVNALIDSNNFFQKLEKTIVQSVVLLSTIKKYEKDTKIQLIKYRYKIGFILYGNAKLYSRDYLYKLEKGDTVGERQLISNRKKIVKEDETMHKYPQSQNLTIKVLNQISILWISYNNYNILRQESIKQGFRQQFNKFDTQLRINFHKKKNQKGQSLSTNRKVSQINRIQEIFH